MIGSTALAANNGTADTMGKNIPVFQGSAGGSYVTSSPVNGTIVSWSFRSAGVTKGDRFVLRVLQPVGSSGTTWKAVGTSAPAAVTSDSGTDALLGPFSASVPIAAGEVIALEPIDEDSTPIEGGVNGKDGIRYFTSPVSDGSTEGLAPGATSNNGQVVPIQATVDVAATTTITATTTTTLPTTTTTQPVAVKNTIAPQVTGLATPGQTMTCDPGSWTGNPTFSYTWLWSQATRGLPFTLKRELPSFGLKRALFTSSSYFLRPATVTAYELLRVGTAKTLTVPDLPAAGGTVGCTVTAHLGAQTVSADSAKVAVHPSRPLLVLQQRLPNGTIRTLPPPRITPGVGVGATNTCTPGTWTNYPGFTYAWYSLGARAAGPGKAAHSRKLLNDSQTLTIAPHEEGLDLECVVTAINSAGSNTAETNSYVVPINPPRALQPPFVDVHTMEPTAAPGVIGPEGAQVIAEQIDLTCDPGKWDRGDLTFVSGWVPVVGDAVGPTGGFGEPLDWTVTGDEFDLDMRPGNLQLAMTVECVVTATTSHGLSATVHSGPIQVWSGCSEVFVELQNGVQVGSSAILYAAPYALTGAGVIAGVAGLLGIETGIVNVFGTTFDSNPLSWIPGFGSGTADEIYTYGPNCEDYQKYLMGQGYTVKQQPGGGP